MQREQIKKRIWPQKKNLKAVFSYKTRNQRRKLTRNRVPGGGPWWFQEDRAVRESQGEHLSQLCPVLLIFIMSELTHSLDFEQDQVFITYGLVGNTNKNKRSEMVRSEVRFKRIKRKWR